MPQINITFFVLKQRK